MRLSMRKGTWPGCRPDSHTWCDRATSRAMSAPELPAPTRSTSPGRSWPGFRYSLECNCTMPGSSACAKAGTQPAWYMAMATTT